MITLNDKSRFVAVLKFSAWAEGLPDDVDFIDYWYSLFLSTTKEQIESDPTSNVNAFYWPFWRNNFERHVDSYHPLAGEGFYAVERAWFARFMQHLVYCMQLSSREIANYYGKKVFRDLMLSWFSYHTLGVDQSIKTFVERFGSPSGVTIQPAGM